MNKKENNEFCNGFSIRGIVDNQCEDVNRV